MMKRPLSNRRSIFSVFSLKFSTDKDTAAYQISKHANIEEIGYVSGSHIIDFKLDLEPSRELNSTVQIEGGEVVNVVLRFPVIENSNCSSLDINPNESNWNSDNVVRQGHSNPHLISKKILTLDETVEGIKQSTRRYRAQVPKEDRIAEEDIDYGI